MLVTLVVIFFRRRGILGAGYDIHDTLIVALEILIIIYAILFILNNTGCLKKTQPFLRARPFGFGGDHLNKIM